MIVVEDIFNKYNVQRENKYSYVMYEIDERDMNYMNWFKLRYSTIEQIINIGVNGLFTLLALISHPHTQKKEHLESTLKMINKHTKFKDIRELKSVISKLVDNGFIATKDYTNTISQNDIFEIVILYNNDELYQDCNKGFKPIPIDYVKRRLLGLTPLQCAIICILITYNRILHKGITISEETGGLVYFCHELNYSFPKLTQMSELLNADRSVIKKNIEILAKEKLISYTYSNEKPILNNINNNPTILNPNYRYRVRLLQRIEYLYYLIAGFDKYDNRSEEEKEYIRKNINEIIGSDKQDIVKDIDYVLSKNNFKFLQKAIENKDIGFYEDKGIDKLVIENFKNKDIESTKKED